MGLSKFLNIKVKKDKSSSDDAKDVPLPPQKPSTDSSAPPPSAMNIPPPPTPSDGPGTPPPLPGGEAPLPQPPMPGQDIPAKEDAPAMPPQEAPSAPDTPNFSEPTSPEAPLPPQAPRAPASMGDLSSPTPPSMDDSFDLPNFNEQEIEAAERVEGTSEPSVDDNKQGGLDWTKSDSDDKEEASALEETIGESPEDREETPVEAPEEESLEGADGEVSKEEESEKAEIADEVPEEEVSKEEVSEEESEPEKESDEVPEEESSGEKEESGEVPEETESTDFTAEEQKTTDQHLPSGFGAAKKSSKKDQKETVHTPDGHVYVRAENYKDLFESIKQMKKNINNLETSVHNYGTISGAQDKHYQKVADTLNQVQRKIMDIDTKLFER